MSKAFNRFRIMLTNHLDVLHDEAKRLNTEITQMTTELDDLRALIESIEKCQSWSTNSIHGRPAPLLTVFANAETLSIKEVSKRTGRTTGSVATALQEHIKNGTVRRIARGMYQRVEPEVVDKGTIVNA